MRVKGYYQKYQTNIFNYIKFLPSHSNSLLLSEGVSMSLRSSSVLSSSSSERREPSLRSRVRLMSGAASFFLVFLPLFTAQPRVGCQINNDYTVYCENSFLKGSSFFRSDNTVITCGEQFFSGASLIQVGIGITGWQEEAF